MTATTLRAPEQPLIGWPCLDTATGLPRLRYTPFPPSPKQSAFLSTVCLEALFGGAAAGGKSIALLQGALQFADVPGYNALILRRKLTDLKLPDGLIDVSRDWLEGKGPTYNANDYKWTFPSGAVLQFGYMAQLGSEQRYKSSQFQFIGFDELTEFPWEQQYTYLFSRLRKAKGVHFGAAPDGLTLQDVPLRVRGATNPGGPGVVWVKNRFIDNDNGELKPFMPAKMTDNPGIDADQYRLSLAELTEVERQRLEDGNWDVMETPGALWRFDEITHIDEPISRAGNVEARIIGLDPSISEATKKGDEAGIVMGSLQDGRLVIEADYSGRMHPDDWARTAVLKYHEYGCSRIVVEKNQGGEMCVSQLGTAADVLDVERPKVVKVNATESKEARAAKAHTGYTTQPPKIVHRHELRSGSLEAQMCMVAGTPVLTDHGWEAIDAVTAGDRVLTRAGWRQVDWSGSTGYTTTLTTVVTSDGAVLRTTPNHPYWVPDIGWVRADQLAQGDRLHGCPTVPPARTSLSSTEVCGSTRTRSPLTHPASPLGSTTAPTSSPTAELCCTDSCGRTHTDPSPKATSSTTATATRSTTTRPTLSCNCAPTTTDSTRPASPPSTPTPTCHRNGPEPCGPLENPAQSSAPAAAPSSSPPGCAPCSAPVHVAAVTTERCAATEVFDLMVDDQHEFFAAGVLVHNTSWVPGTSDVSPDRVDALVWLVRNALFGEGEAATFRTPRSTRDRMSARIR